MAAGFYPIQNMLLIGHELPVQKILAEFLYLAMVV
jgi:hypothetical protein